MTQTLGNTKEKLIEQLAQYRYYSDNYDEKYANFLFFMIKKVNDGTIDEKLKEFNITDAEIQNKVTQYESAILTAGGKKKSKKKSRKSKKYHKKSKKHHKRKSRRKRR